MNYFVTVDMSEKHSGLSKDKAIEIAKKEYNKTKPRGINIPCIGRKVLIKNKWVCTLLPLHYYV